MSQQSLFAHNFIDVRIDHLEPNDVYVEQVPTNVIVELQKQMSKAVWRPAPGRKLGFTVNYHDSILGLLFLASPVINMGARDQFLNFPKNPSDKGKELRHWADLSVCVASQPFGWYWNGGKLMALLATTLGDYWQDRYDDELRGIITTSLWGRSSQYNRVYKFLGYTKGYGHVHIDDERYSQMLQWMKANNVEIPSSKFGTGSNPRMRRIQAYIKASGDKTLTLNHGEKRGIYYHETVPSEDRQQVIEGWLSRWGQPRYDRKQFEAPPYLDGLS